LNTQAFTQTRTRLSECWDTIKRLEKERKKERAVQREAFKQNYDQVMEKIQSFTQQFQSGTLSVNEANQQIEQIVTLMRQVELGRDELRHLRDQLNGARKLVLEKVKAEEQDRHQHEQEKEKQKRAKLTALRTAVEQLMSSVESYEVDRIISERDQLLAQITEAAISRQEKQELERLLKPLKDLIAEKKEQAILNLSADDQQSLQQLREILKDRKARRQEIKNQLEVYRKAAGASSGFDFEKAMELNGQISAEKDRLEKINESIEEIEQKISDLREKI
jgi:chromosome segregation ATPase